MARRTTNTWVDKLLPAIVLLPLSAAAASFLYGHFVPKSNIGLKIAEQCVPSETGALQPYLLDYTGIRAFDRTLCGYVAFFHAAMHPTSLPLTTDFLVSFATYTVIPYAEAARNGRSKLLAFPLLVGLLYQFWSIAVINPIYWFAFLWSGSANLHKGPGGEHTKIDQAHAEAILFSVLIGYFIPTAGMFLLDDPYVTAIWQIFPVFMTLSQWGHRLGRPSSRHSRSGYRTVQATYIFLFIITASYHVSIVWPKFKDFAWLKRVFGLDPSPTDMPFELAAMGFLKWDAFFGTGGIVLASLWFARNVKELLILVVWYVIGIVLVGPGAALAGVFMWRESILEAARPGAAQH